MPDIDFNLESSVGEHRITNGHIALFLVSRLKVWKFAFFHVKIHLLLFLFFFFSTVTASIFNDFLSSTSIDGLVKKLIDEHFC
jgi:hypothetical protein